jgi:hypothetical protein
VDAEERYAEDADRSDVVRARKATTKPNTSTSKASTTTSAAPRQTRPLESRFPKANIRVQERERGRRFVLMIKN